MIIQNGFITFCTYTGDCADFDTSTGYPQNTGQAESAKIPCQYFISRQNRQAETSEGTAYQKLIYTVYVDAADYEDLNMGSVFLGNLVKLYDINSCALRGDAYCVESAEKLEAVGQYKFVVW